MTKTEETSLLLTQFREFYGQLIELKRFLKSRPPLETTPVGESGDDHAAHAIGDRLSAIMERQAQLANRRGTDYTGIYRQAEYVMAALADEILLLHVDWGGKQSWNNHLMEYRLCGSRIAGNEFYKRLDRLLETPDPIYKDLATVYLMAIMLGFRGKYWNRNDRGEVDSYRRRLFTFIFHGQSELKNETKILFPEAYLHTVEQGERAALSRGPGRWYFLLFALMVAYVLLARAIWQNSTDDIHNILPRIEHLLHSMGFWIDVMQ